MQIKLIKDVRLESAPIVLILAGSEIDTTPKIGEMWITKGYAVLSEKKLCPCCQERKTTDDFDGEICISCAEAKAAEGKGSESKPTSKKKG